MFTHLRTWLILFLALCFALSAAAKPAPKAMDAQRELQVIYNKINAAAMQKDVDGVYAFNTDDYTEIDKKGHVHEVSEDRQEMEQGMEMVDSITATSIIQSFTGTGTEATVTIKEHAVVRIANTTTGRAVKFTADDTARDHWIKTEEGWKRNRTRFLSGKNALHKNF